MRLYTNPATCLAGASTDGPRTAEPVHDHHIHARGHHARGHARGGHYRRQQPDPPRRRVPAESPFSPRIASGIRLARHISGTLGPILSRPGAIYLSPALRVSAPAYPDETVTSTTELAGIRPAKPIVTLRPSGAHPDGPTGAEGEAVVPRPWLRLAPAR